MDHWQPYEPTPGAPWNLRRVVHLHCRAGFAATWPELSRDLAGKPNDAVTRLLTGHARIDGRPADYGATATLLVDAAVGSQLDRRLKAAWVYRMLFGPDPLGERLVLTWHNHFATSNVKVQNLKQMQQQNDLLRQLARGRFGAMLVEVVRDPAMLVWLDADKNRAGHANENLARELMELFTLGIGNYSEADVQAAARALTGWKVVNDQFHEQPTLHDEGEKVILGKTGNHTGNDLLKQLGQHPATARRVAWRIAKTLLADSVIDDVAIDVLVTGLRERELDLAWAVETIVRSERFFAAANIGARICGPPEFVIGAVRALECFQPPPSTLLLADWMARMGQDLFYPPNVGGWTEGRAWLSSGALVARANFVAALVTGRLTAEGGPPDLAALVTRHSGATATNRGVEWLAELLVGGLPKDVVLTITNIAEQNAAALGGPWAAAVQALLARPRGTFDLTIG